MGIKEIEADGNRGRLMTEITECKGYAYWVADFSSSCSKYKESKDK